MSRRYSYVPGSKIRLLRDVTTNGGQRFRAGLVMTLTGTHYKLWATVRVRAKDHSFMMSKWYGRHTFEVIWTPPKKEEL